jgi:hypothetical protein
MSQFLQSAQGGLVIDISSAGGIHSGSQLQALAPKLEANQYWTKESVPGKTGYFWIVSAAQDSSGQKLVIDIMDPVSSGSQLQALVKRNENNQYWTFAPAELAQTPGNFGSYANYLFDSDCNPLTGVQV